MAEHLLDQVSVDKMFDLRGVVAVVTGGGSGIGMMITSALVANGAKVFIIGPKQSDLDQAAKTWNDAAEKIGKVGRIIGIEGDIRKKAEAKRLAEEVAKHTPYITTLFNNAGVSDGSFKRPTEATAAAFVSAFFDPITEDQFDNVLRTNAVGPYWLTFAFLPLLEKWKEHGYGDGERKFAPQVVMTSSMNGWTKDPATSGFTYPYLYSKSAIGLATASLAHELLPLGVRVNGIAPGLFVTEMSAPGSSAAPGLPPVNPPDMSRLQFATPSAQLPPELGGPSPVGKNLYGGIFPGSHRDMGSLAIFLVSNWYVNGETVLIDGGTLLKHPSSY